MIAKRSRAHRSRCGKSFSSLIIAPFSDAILGVLVGTKATKLSGRRLSASSAGASRPSAYWLVARLLKGAIKRSSCATRSAISLAPKRSNRLFGSRSVTTGGMNR